MLAFAIAATVAALAWCLLVLLANRMRSSPGPMVYRRSVVLVLFVAAVIWIGWLAVG